MPCGDFVSLNRVVSVSYQHDRFNHYLEAVGSDRQVWQFGAELADGVAWSTLLHAIDPSACPEPAEHDPETNARNVMAAVRKMGIKVRTLPMH